MKNYNDFEFQSNTQNEADYQLHIQVLNGKYSYKNNRPVNKGFEKPTPVIPKDDELAKGNIANGEFSAFQTKLDKAYTKLTGCVITETSKPPRYKLEELYNGFKHRKYDASQCINAARDYVLTNYNDISKRWLNFTDALILFLAQGSNYYEIKKHYTPEEQAKRDEKLKEIENQRLLQEQESEKQYREEIKREADALGLTIDEYNLLGMARMKSHLLKDLTEEEAAILNKFGELNAAHYTSKGEFAPPPQKIEADKQEEQLEEPLTSTPPSLNQVLSPDDHKALEELSKKIGISKYKLEPELRMARIKCGHLPLSDVQKKCLQAVGQLEKPIEPPKQEEKPVVRDDDTDPEIQAEIDKIKAMLADGNIGNNNAKLEEGL